MRVRLQFTNGTHYAYHAEFDDVAPLAADIEAIRFGIQYLTARIFRLSSVTAQTSTTQVLSATVPGLTTTTGDPLTEGAVTMSDAVYDIATSLLDTTEGNTPTTTTTTTLQTTTTDDRPPTTIATTTQAQHYCV